jgi:hypothetical protein
LKNVEKRLSEFIAYHKNGDGECNSVVLKGWADQKKLTTLQRFELCYWFSVTYCVLSAIVLYKNRLDHKNLEGLKNKIIFQSDRKYVKMENRFEKVISFYLNNLKNPYTFLNKVIKNGKMDIEKAVNECTRWPLFGRFSSFLFLEAFSWLTSLPVINSSIDWKKGDTATSGLLNVFGYDKEADEFDKKNTLYLSYKNLNDLLKKLINEIRKNGGITDITCIETTLCAYRKHYKGTRYNGYYLDRMLEELNKMKTFYPAEVKELFSIRKEKFNQKYLGELNGWTSIRKDLKKLYKIKGLMN